MRARTMWGLASAGLTTLALFWGCGGSLGSSSGGESHFLIQCDDTCGGGLSCISGVCTRGCVLDEENSCDDLHADAKCTDSIEPGEVAACDLACVDDDDCSSLGTNYTCETGQCRGVTNLSTSAGGTNGNGGTSTTGTASGGAGGAANTCDLSLGNLPDGATWIVTEDCDTCRCTRGEVECSPMVEGICVEAVPVFPCQDGLERDPVEVTSASIHEDLLMLEVSYGGGCERHDFSLCYEPGLDTSGSPDDPIVGQLRLNHNANNDPCGAEASYILHFDLQPYAEYVKAELDVTEAVVDTSFGSYSIGERSCTETRASIGNLVAAAVDRTLDYGCVENIDCARVMPLSCLFGSCGELIALGGEAAFWTTMEALEATVCDEYFPEECRISQPPACEAPLPIRCVEGRCVELEP